MKLLFFKINVNFNKEKNITLIKGSIWFYRIKNLPNQESTDVEIPHMNSSIY